MKQIELANGKGFALVDDEDYEWLNENKWSLGSHGYAVRAGKSHDGKKLIILMHREIMDLKPGDRKQVDHVNSNKIDNRRQNLRVCTGRENQRNRRKTYGTSQYKGVTWVSRISGWMAYIQHDVPLNLGMFDSEQEAAIAYDNEARKLFGEFAKLNFPDIDRPAQGRRGVTPRTPSGYFGVYRNGQNWQAKITVKGKLIRLGAFKNEEDAARAFDEATRKYRGQDARTNFHY